jgi:hypothetical protein
MGTEISPRPWRRVLHRGDRLHLANSLIERHQHLVDDASDKAKWMLHRNTVLDIHIREQFTALLVRSAHPCLPLQRTADSDSLDLASRLFQRPASEANFLNVSTNLLPSRGFDSTGCSRNLPFSPASPYPVRKANGTPRRLSTSATG